MLTLFSPPSPVSLSLSLGIPIANFFMDHGPDSAEAFAGKLHDLLTESDNETVQFSFQEEMIEEVMQELYKEISFSAVPVPANPSPSLSPSCASNALPILPVFIDDGKNGSCGASVSDSASTVMVGIEVLGSAGEFPAREVGMQGTENGSPAIELEDDRSAALVGFGVGEEKKMDGCDGGDLDEEWLGRVLSWGQQGQVQVMEATQWF